MQLEQMFGCKTPLTQTVTITPDMAKDWLENRNSKNRKIVGNFVSYLAREIKSGRWQVTHQGLGFDTEGKLLDGQHRLSAIIEAGESATMRITFGLSCDSMDAIDTGKSRTNAHIITLNGRLGVVTNQELAILRMVYKITQKKSPMVEMDMLERHVVPLRWSLRVLPASPHKCVANSITRGVLTRAWYTCDLGKLEQFAETLRSGIFTTANSQPIQLLVIFLGKVHDAGNIQSRQKKMECYYKTERALMAFLQDETIGRLMESPQELFLFPEEEGQDQKD